MFDFESDYSNISGYPEWLKYTLAILSVVCWIAVLYPEVDPVRWWKKLTHKE